MNQSQAFIKCFFAKSVAFLAAIWLWLCTAEGSLDLVTNYSSSWQQVEEAIFKSFLLLTGQFLQNTTLYKKGDIIISS